jgi:hypothetical protein
MARNVSGRASRIIGKMTGFYLSETEYNFLTQETKALIRQFDINKLVERGNGNTEKTIKILLTTKNIITNDLNDVYSKRLTYLQNKAISDPNNPETPGKIRDIQETMKSLNNILEIIRSKLNQLDPSGVIQNNLVKNVTSQPPVASSYSDMGDINIMFVQSFDGVNLLKGLGSVLNFLGDTATYVISSGGKRRKTIRRRMRRRNGGTMSKKKRRTRRTTSKKRRHY